MLTRWPLRVYIIRTAREPGLIISIESSLDAMFLGRALRWSITFRIFFSPVFKLPSGKVPFRGLPSGSPFDIFSKSLEKSQTRALYIFWYYKRPVFTYPVRERLFMANKAQQVMYNSSKARFSAFSGVFTPTVLTILGLILFLRLGWVVGQTGLLGALAIIALANGVSFITGLCLSSIATNMYVKTGGLYYMISRTLGLEIGGAIGIPLYLSQAISIAFYIIGFSEALTTTFPALDPKLISTALLLIFGVLAFCGADFAMRIQYFILAILMCAIASFFLGGWGDWSRPEMFSQGTGDVTFWVAFAIFFPAVTGISVGVSMSGDLKDPVKAIPKGALWAIGFTAMIYFGAAIWLAFHAPKEELISNKLIMYDIAAWPELILLGVWASTLSSALGSMVAAPRTLQAIASDEVAPGFFKSQMGSPTEPRAAVIVTSAIALVFIWMGNLNFVAPIITMFFLNTYGMINLTAAIETIVGNPSFRPSLKIHWSLSLIGAIGCYASMFLIHTPATILAIIVSFGIFLLLQRRSLKQNWGDVRGGAWFSMARFSIFRLEEERWEPKNWRPNIIVFTPLREGIDPLLEMGGWLSHGHGIVSFHHLLIGDYMELATKGLRDASRKQLRKSVSERKGEILSGSSIARNFEDGALTTLQVYGIAGIESNAALFGWGRNKEARIQQMALANKILALNKSTIFLKYDESRKFGKMKSMDIWWRGRDKNADLMLLFAYIISRSSQWAKSRVRLIRVIDSEKGEHGAYESLSKTLSWVRVNAEPKIMIREQGQSFSEVLAKTSLETDLVFLGLARPNPENADKMLELMDFTLGTIGSALIVRSGEQENILDDGNMV